MPGRRWYKALAGAAPPRPLLPVPDLYPIHPMPLGAAEPSWGAAGAADLPPLDPLALPQLVTAIPGPLSQAWLRRLKAVESPNVTAVASDFPIVWQQARGGAIRDVDGNTLVDATSAFGVALLGHGPDAVRAAVHRQADQLLHGMGDVHPPAVRIALLEKLQEIAPADLGGAVLCGGGAEAVEVALKTALLATGKAGVIAFSGAYHGLGHGALDATARRDFRFPFAAQLACNTVWVPFPHPLRPPVGVAAADLLAYTLARVEELLAHPAMGGVPIGAVLVEPIQGRGGTVIPPAGFLSGLRQLCDRHGVLLVLDEIYTGCCRTGSWFACQSEDVVPDILCVGKALGGGLPIGACLGRPHVMACWGESQGEALHTSTFLGHPLAAAAALASLNALQDMGMADLARSLGVSWLAELSAALADHPAVLQVRGRGLMLGIELRDWQGVPAGQRAWQVVTGCLRRGVVVLPCGTLGEVIQLTPPAVLSAEQRSCIVQALVAALADTQASHG